METKSLLILAIIAISTAMPSSVRADRLVGPEGLTQIANMLRNGNCETRCGSTEWTVETIPFPQGYRAQTSGERLFLATAGAANCGSRGCISAYVLRDATHYVLLKESWNLGPRAISASDIPAAEARRRFTQVALGDRGDRLVSPLTAAGPAQGAPQVISTGVFVVGGQRVTLEHIQGVDGAQARGIAAFIAARGGTITCEPLPPSAGMRCRTGDGVDLAEAALFNGGARAAADAPANYKAAELAAREARRGIWSDGGGAAPSAEQRAGGAPRQAGPADASLA